MKIHPALGSANKTEDSKILDLERICGFSLPLDYREFLKETSGSFLEPVCEILQNDKDSGFMVEALCGFSSVKILDLLEIMNAKPVFLPENALPLSTVFDGGVFLLWQRQQQLGIWYQPLCQDDKIAKLCGIDLQPIFLFETFTDFLQNLKPVVRSENLRDEELKKIVLDIVEKCS